MACCGSFGEFRADNEAEANYKENYEGDTVGDGATGKLLELRRLCYDIDGDDNEYVD